MRGRIVTVESSASRIAAIISASISSLEAAPGSKLTGVAN